MVNKIQKRLFVTDKIFEELEKKYPLKGDKSGICYVQSMDYITVEVETFNNPTFRKLIKNNSQVLIVYMYLRERMCHNGWYTVWDIDSIEDIIERLVLWGISEQESSCIIDILIEKGMVQKVSRDGIDYLTDFQQIYNWEMLQAKRARDRKSKQSDSDTTSRKSDQNPLSPQSSSVSPPPPPGFENMSSDFGFDLDLPFN